MTYNIIKFVHIFSASLLLTSMVIASLQWYKASSNESTQLILKYTGFSILPLAVFQLGSGVTLLSLKSNTLKVWGLTIIMIFLTWLGSWLVLTYCLMQARYKIMQRVAISIAFIAVVSLIYLMSNPL